MQVTILIPQLLHLVPAVKFPEICSFREQIKSAAHKFSLVPSALISLNRLEVKFSGLGGVFNQLRHFSPRLDTISRFFNTTNLIIVSRSCCFSHINTSFQAQSNTMQLCTFCVARILSDTLVLIIISNVIFLCECFLSWHRVRNLLFCVNICVNDSGLADF